MAKQINIDLVFNANTSQARSQMASLQNQLNQLQNTNRADILGEGFTKNLAQAQSSLISLKTNLQSAFNVDTGRLDLSKFNANLKASGMTLQTYRLSLQSMGVEGREAFNKLTSAIVQGELPLRKTKNLLTSMINTFGSSIKWTVAYGAIDSIRQGFSNAFQYAEDLNESLTNIGVVTQKSTTQMSKFAEQANKAAKSLASTTVAYTDAALIYYQQGLSDDQVAERAATTMKLANVVGESASTVSEWMTAIWNNFDDGSKKLEYYADVMAKLGAETASSADEIAGGFEKFAAVADTVGLSYEKGAAAIATVTATTRQSADVVGTAFKTLFARIQDLDLGKTLDDGTTLGQYSEALNKVGINIKTTSGDLKDMDLILEEMGSTWKTLSSDEQVALAKSVAGVRQYTQLIALMDNYDYFEQLTKSAENAEGTLEQQQERWAESWEASSNRVKAAAEGIYSNLIDDDFFIDLNNVFADLLTLVDGFMDAMGGLKTILPAIGGLMMYAFGPTILTSIKGFVSNLQGVKASEIASLQGMSRTALKEQASMYDYAQDTSTRTASTIAKEELKTQEEIWKIKRNISDEEAERLQQGNQKLLNLKEELQTLAKQSDELQKQQATLFGNKNSMVNNFASNFGKDNGEVLNQTKELSNEINKYATMNEKDFDPEAARKDIIARRDAGATFKHLGIPGNKDLAQFDLTLAKMREIEAATNKQGITTQAVTQKKEALIQQLIELGVSEDKARAKVNELTTELQENSAAFTENGIKIQKVEKALKEGENTYKEEADKFRNLAKETKKMPLGDALIQTAGAASMLTAGISSLTTGMSSLFDMFKDGTWTFEGVMSSITGISMAVSMILPGLKMMKGLFLQGAAGAVLETAALQINAAAIEKNWHKKMKLSKTEQAAYIQKKLNIALEEAEIIATILSAKADGQSTVEINEKTIAIDKETDAILKNIAAETADAANPEEGGLVSKETANLFGGKGKIGWANIGKFAGGIAIIVATFAAMAAVLSAVRNAWNAASKAAEQAQKDATAMAEQYQKTKTEYEDLKSTLEDYNKSRSAIDSLTQGTKEWQEAIQKVNQETLELLQKYPQLLEMEGAIDRTNGQIQLTAEGQQALLDQQSKELTQSYNNQLYANLNAQDKTLKSSRTDLTRRELDTNATAEALGLSGGGVAGGVIGGVATSAGISALAAAGVGAAAGSVVPVVGTIIGAVAGVIIGATTAYLSADKNDTTTGETALDALAEKAQSLESGVTELNSNWQANIDALQQEGKISEALAKELKENTTAEKVQNQLLKEEQQRKLREEAESQVTQQYLTNAGFIGWNQYGDNVSDMSNAKRTELENKVIAEAGYKLIGHGVSDNYSEWDGGWRNANAEADKVAARYRELLKEEFNTTNVKSTNFNWTDKTFDFKYKDEQGKWQTVSRSFETVSEAVKQDIIAESNLEKDLLKYTTDLTNEVAKLQNSRAQGANLVANFLSNGSISDVTGEDLRETEGKSAEEVWKQIENVDELATKFGLDFDKFKEAYDKFNTIEGRLNALAQWNAKELASARDTFKNQAETLDTTAEALEGYMFHLIEENSALQNNIGVAKEATLQNFKLAKGVKDLKAAFDEEFEVLQEGNKDSIEYYESLGKLEQIIEQIFGLTVSGDFVANNLGKIQDLANGSTEAFQELRKAANESFIDSWGVDTNLANALKNELDELTSEIQNKDLSIGAELTLDSSGAIDALNEALFSGKATIEEIESLFSNANIKMPEPRQLVLPIATTSKSVTYVAGMPVSETSTENITMQTVPYFGETPEIKQVTKTLDYTKVDKNGKTSSDSLEYTTWEAVPTTSNGVTEIEVESLGNTTTDTAAADYGGETEIAKAKRAKDLDNEIDRYHEIDEAIENTERELDRLSKAKDRAFGKDKLALMDQEMAKNRELLLEEQKRVEEAEKWLQQDESQLLANYGVELDSEGVITNYNEVIESITSKMKNMTPDTNEYDQWSEYLSNFKDDAAKYEESLDAVAEGQQTVIDLQNEIADAALQRTEFIVQIKVDMADDDAAYIDFLMQKIEDDAFAAAEAIELEGRRMEDVLDKIEATERGIDEVLKEIDANGGVITDDQANFLRSSRDNLIEYNADLLEIRNTIQDKLIETYDAWNEKIDENISKFDQYNSVIEHYRNIVDLVGQDRLGISDDTMSLMYDTQMKNDSNRTASAKAKLDANKAVLEEARKQRAAAVEKDDQDYWDDVIKKAEEEVWNATEEFNNAFETQLQTIADSFKNNIDTIVKNFEKSVSGIYKSLEDVQTAFDRQKEINGRYLADYEKTYEISKLNRQIEQSLNNTDSVKNQKQLRGLQEELLEMSKDGNQVSKMDMEYMQKKYNLMLAEQALRDAQNAKSVVRLRRDSSGNFGYVYTADQSAIDEAQQKYEDALYDMQDFGAKSLETVQGNIIALQQEFSEALAALGEQYGTDTEEYKEKEAELIEYYTGQMQYYTDQGSRILEWGQDINADYNANMADDFEDTFIGKMYPDLKDFEGYYDESTKAMIAAGNSFENAVELNQTQISAAFSAIGLSAENMDKKIQEEMGTTKTASNDTASAIKTDAETMVTALTGEEGAMAAVSTFQTSFSSKMELVRSATEATIGTINDLLAVYSSLAEEAGKDYTPNTTEGDIVKTGVTGGPSGLGDGLVSDEGETQTTWAAPEPMQGDYFYHVTSKPVTNNGTHWFGENITIYDKNGKVEDKSWYVDDWNASFNSNTKATGYRTIKNANGYNLNLFKVENIKDDDGNSRTFYLEYADIAKITGTQEGVQDWIDSLRMYQFDTGGYTGSWGPEGRMAMLHQKELVLNAQDTENFLSAIKIVRSMADQIETNALIARYGLNAYQASTIKPQGDVLEQNVTIHAEFPNATNHSEIEEAFNNLNILASQYANRK